MTQALQNAKLAIASALPENPDESLLLIATKCCGLIHGYDARWRDADYIPSAVEITYTSDLYNPETQRTSRSFTVAGKLDIDCTRHGRSIVFDHKTTSHDITDPNGPYWRQLAVESQPSMYMLLKHLNGVKVDEAVWDCVRKPQIKPAKLSKAERASVVANQSYCKRRMSVETVQAMQTEERETLEMYEARLADDCTNERPEWYFARKPVPRLDGELLEFAGELWEQGQEILHARRTNRWSRNSGACLLYNSPCKFLGICSGHDTPDSDRWQKKQFVHNELAGDQFKSDGREVLTNSRIRCFQTCRRKHFYEYELGIERQDEEEREALLFGQLWHVCLNAWWSTFIPKENDDGYSISAAVNETAAAASQA